MVEFLIGCKPIIVQWKNELKIELESWNLSQDSSKSWILENFQLKTRNLDNFDRKEEKRKEIGSRWMRAKDFSC